MGYSLNEERAAALSALLDYLRLAPAALKVYPGRPGVWIALAGDIAATCDSPGGALDKLCHDIARRAG